MMKKYQKALWIAGLSFAVLLISCIIFFVFNFYIEMNTKETAVVLEYQDDYKDKKPSAKLKGKYLFKKGFPLDVQVKGKVDTDKLDEYKLVYSASFLHLKKQSSKTITVKDTTAPVLTLQTKEGYSILPNQEYVEEGYEAEDNFDGKLTDKVTISVTGDIITYSVTDSSGNHTQVERKIPYLDTIAPELTLKGETNITIEQWGTYSEPGYVATDNCDGDITSKVIKSGYVDHRVSGTYTLTYSVKDTYGNQAIAKRTVTVKKAVVHYDTIVPNGKTIYLTFDDGPGPYTEELLTILDKYNVKATFFVVNGKYNHLIAKEAQAGHAVGIHSTTHNYGQIYASPKAYFDDLYQMQGIIYGQTGIRPTIVRFPGGSSNTVSRKYCSGIMSQLTKSLVDSGFQYFDWNVSSGDAGGTTSTATVVQNVINGVSNKNISIVLQHDIKQFSVKAVEDIIIWGLNNGYTFKPLDMTSPTVHQRVNN